MAVHMSRAVRFFDQPLNRNTFWMMLGNGSRLIFQAGYFVLLARNLGPRQFGTFVALAAAASIVIPFVGNGFDGLMIRDVARDRSNLPESLGKLLAVTFVSGVLLSTLLVPICLLLLPHTISTFVATMIISADVCVVRFVGVAAQTFQAVEQLGRTAALNAFLTLMRLLGIVILVMIGQTTLTAWSVAYFAASAGASIVALYCLIRFFGLPRLPRSPLWGDMREGFYFSASEAAKTIYDDVDKTMLARLSTLEATAIYAAAYRLVEVAFVPVRSILAAAYPGFFRNGSGGIHTSVHYGWRLLRKSLPYSLCVSSLLFLAAPTVPWFLGPGYIQVTEALRWLAIIPFLRTFHSFFADTLTGAGQQRLRTVIQVAIAAFNILINLWIIPAYGWRGASWSSIASDGLLALSLFLSLKYLSLRASATTAAVSAAMRSY